MNKMVRRLMVLAMLVALCVLPAAASADVEVTPSNIASTDFSENTTYNFIGNFSGEIAIKVAAGKDITLDASGATFASHVKITLGRIAEA